MTKSPGEKKIIQLVDEIGELDLKAMSIARDRQANLAKVPGSLGKLEDFSIKIAGITGKATGNEVSKQCVAIMCADNGVVREGVAAAPQSVTLNQTINFTRRITGVGSQALYFGIDLLVTDVGVAQEIPPQLYTDSMLDQKGNIPVKIVNRRLMNGTDNLAKGPSMERETAVKAILTGFMAADAMKKAGVQLAGIGEMGIGNTTTSSCLLRAVTGIDAEPLVDRGGGLNDNGLKKKIKIVNEAGERARGMDPISMLAEVGGLDICAMVGCYLGCARNRIPAVIDGFISIVAACVAREFCPNITDYMFASHKSKESGYLLAIERLDLSPMFDLKMRLGEGSGCPIAFKIIEASCASMNLMMTLSEGDINDSYLDELRKGNFFA